MATVKFYLKKLKCGEGSVYLRFRINKDNKFKLSTGERIPLDFWDSIQQQAKTKYRDSFLFNQSLTTIKSGIIQLYRDNKTKSVLELKAMAKPLVAFGKTEEPEKKSIYPVLLKFIEWCYREKDEKTAKKFEAHYSKRKDKKTGELIDKGKLFEFNPKLELNRLDNKFYDDFKEFLFKKGLLDSTVYKYFTTLSTFLTWADSRGYEIHYTKETPTHLSWEIIKRRNEPITATLAELEKLEALEITEALINEKLPPEKHGRRGERSVQALSLTRDYFIIECRTCQRISDVKKFDLKDVDGFKWNNKVTKGKRLNAKTKIVSVPFNTTFTAPAWDILHKHNFVLPEISEQKLNKNIKLLFRLAGITHPVTVAKWKENKEILITKDKCDWISTHTGRKTFITIGLQFMMPKLVKDLAGISWNTLKHYEGQSEDSTLINGLNSIPTKALMKAG